MINDHPTGQSTTPFNLSFAQLYVYEAVIQKQPNNSFYEDSYIICGNHRENINVSFHRCLVGKFE